MASGRPDLRWAAKVRASAAFCVAGAAAGAGLYFGNLAYTGQETIHVSVTIANQSVACNSTVNVIGAISTNGRGETIRYQWVYGGVADPPRVVAITGSSGAVLVKLKWTFHGKGTGQAVAELRVLNPRPTESSITFPYSCPG